MKKILSLLLVAAMLLGVAATVSAQDKTYLTAPTTANSKVQLLQLMVPLSITTRFILKNP